MRLCNRVVAAFVVCDEASLLQADGLPEINMDFSLLVGWEGRFERVEERVVVGEAERMGVLPSMHCQQDEQISGPIGAALHNVESHWRL